MGSINQFAKISPLVDNTGHLIGTDGKTTTRMLKENELGIIKGENIIGTVIGGNFTRLGAAVYNNDNFNELISGNTDGSLNGKMFAVSNSNGGYDIKIIHGTSAYVVTDNLLYAAYFNIKDATAYSDSYIGALPYKIMRVTIRVNKDVTKDDGSAFIGKVILTDSSNEQKEITSFDLKGNVSTLNDKGYDVFQCETLFNNYSGAINITFKDSSSNIINKSNLSNIDIEVCVEYVLI